jgi:hypothetical protein
MPNLLKKWCPRSGSIPTDTIKKLDVASFGHPVTATLTGLGWDGTLVAAIGLQLLPDNRQVQRGQILLCGNISKEPVEIQANLLWPEAEPDVFLTITLPEGTAYCFDSGTLCSDLITCEDYQHCFRQDGRAIVPTEWQDKGVCETSIRAVCHLNKTSNGRLGPHIKTTILIFPHSVEELNQLSDATQSPAWPGIRVVESTSSSRESRSGGNRYARCSCAALTTWRRRTSPPPDELQFHVAAIMRSARRPTVCTKQKMLKKQWEKGLENIEALEQEPTIVWPEAPRHAPAKGNYSKSKSRNYRA